MSAPACAVFRLLILKGSPDSLAMKHLSEVGSRFSHVDAVAFWDGYVSRRIPPVTEGPLLLPTSQCRSSVGLPCGRLAMRRAMAEYRRFHVPRDHLRMT